MQLHVFVFFSSKFVDIDITPREAAKNNNDSDSDDNNGDKKSEKQKQIETMVFRSYFFVSFIHQIADFATMSIIIGLTLDWRKEHTTTAATKKSFRFHVSYKLL